MPVAKRRFFKRSKKEEVIEKEKLAVEKLQKGGVAFTKIQRVEKKGKAEMRKRPHFPKFSRSITEPTINLASNKKELKQKQPQSRLKWVFLVLLIMLGLSLNIWMGIALYTSFSNWARLLTAREKLSSEMATWENISQKYPNYRDAYVEGALLAYRLGDNEKEQYFLKNLQLLDPNFPITKSFEQLHQLQNTINN